MTADWFSPISKHIFHPLYAIKDRSTQFRWLKDLEKSQYLTVDKLRNLQWSRLTRLLHHAYNNCPFYRRRMDDYGVTPRDIKDESDFCKLPVLTKEDIQTNLRELIATNYSSNSLVANRTGGSTGKPIQYFHDKDRVFSMAATAIRHDRWAGKDIGDRFAGLWGARHDWPAIESLKYRIKNLLVDRLLVLDTSSLTEEKLFKFVEDLRKFRPKCILAYSNSMYIFSKFVRDNKISDLDIKTIITSAEVLHDHERKLIEDVFETKVFNRYGCREVSVIASECEEHCGLHVAADTLFVQLIKNGKPSAPSEEGEIVITDLLNYGMPFIRYRIEDMGTSSQERCSCGRSLPLIKDILGRTTDFLITPEGVMISGASLTIYLIANTPGVRQAQLVQDKKEKVQINVVRGPAFNTDSMTFLENTLPNFFGPTMTYNYNFVEEIPKTSSGKYRFSICNIQT